MADVEIMLEQMKIMFNNHAEVARHKMGKVIRLEQRVNEANKS
jgi:hypothetical protein